MKSLTRTGWLLGAVLFLSAISSPAAEEKPAVVELFEDEDEDLIPQLVNESGEPGEARREDGDRFSGLHTLRVTPLQRYTAQIKGWSFPVAEKPNPGQYRFIRFAWKKLQGQGVMLQLCGNTDNTGWGHRYHAGVSSVGWESLQIADKAPGQWEVVTRDLFKDFGPFTVTGIAFTAMDGAALYDHIYLGRTVEDLDRVTEAFRGKDRPKPPPGDRLPGLWQDLLSRDPAVSAPAEALLASAGNDGVAWVRDRLKKPAAGDEDKQIAKWIVELDDDNFQVRQAASQALARAGDAARPHLERAFRETESAEVRERIKNLLGGKPGEMNALSADGRRLLRLVRVLDQMGTPAAREALDTLAASADDVRVQREAKSVLRRSLEAK